MSKQYEAASSILLKAESILHQAEDLPLHVKLDVRAAAKVIIDRIRKYELARSGLTTQDMNAHGRDT